MERLLILLLFISSCSMSNGPLDELYTELHKVSHPKIITQFKNIPFDTAIIFDPKFDPIFSKALGDILKENDLKNKTLTTLTFYNLDTISLESRMTIVGGFHKYLNNNRYDLNSINKQIIEAANK